MSSFNRRISDTNIRLGEVRFSYVNVFSRRPTADGSQGKYSVCIVIPKDNKEAVSLFKEAFDAACAVGKTTKWNGKVPARVTLPLHDGDEERPDSPEFEGCWYFNCSSNVAPGVRVRENGKIVEALDEEDFYSGCYGAVTVNLFPYASNGNNGVGVGLNNVIKTRDGERLSGGRSADEDFSDLGD